MKEIVKVNLENEMDLILAHKRTMKLCELTGLSLINQTSVATAVSEIARCAIDHGKNACLILNIEERLGKKLMWVIIRDVVDFTVKGAEATSFARRLVDDIEIQKSQKEVQIILKQYLNFSGTLTETRIQSFIQYFENEPPLSAYDELRRKNLQLQDLADKIRESENEYRILTDSLPLMMFSATNRGNITFTNKWLRDFFTVAPADIQPASWQNVIAQADYSSFSKDLMNAMNRQSVFTGQYRFKQKSSSTLIWHQMSMVPVKNEKDIVTQWIGYIVDTHAQRVVDQTLKDNKELKEIQSQLFANQSELEKKVIELNRSNYELEQFAHLASHDLQEPLRKLFFYSDVLKKRYSERLEESGVNMLNNMSLAASRMKELISDLLSYSQLQKQKLNFEQVDLNETIRDIVRDLDLQIREKSATIRTGDLPSIQGNPIRLRQLFANLISNALKYSRKNVPPVVEIETSQNNGTVIIKVKDNGIGFDEQYRERIFGLFERLHTRDEIPGTGIGLSICKRITELHHGSISAESRPNEFSIFQVTLPLQQEELIEAES